MRLLSAFGPVFFARITAVLSKIGTAGPCGGARRFAQSGFPIPRAEKNIT